MKLDWKGVAVIAGAALVVYFITRRDVQKIASAVNPANPENVFYKTASAATPQQSVGSWLYDLLHPGEKG